MIDKNKVSIWRMGEWYKVYSEDTGLIRQLANAEECRISGKYHQSGRFVGLDVMLPFKPKFGRRINRVLKIAGFSPKGRKPDLTADDILTLEREIGLGG